MDAEFLVMGGIALLCLGAAFGRWAEARLWRAKAANNPRYRKESGGALYYVIPAEEYDEFHSNKTLGFAAVRLGVTDKMSHHYTQLAPYSRRRYHHR